MGQGRRAVVLIGLSTPESGRVPLLTRGQGCLLLPSEAGSRGFLCTHPPTPGRAMEPDFRHCISCLSLRGEYSTLRKQEESSVH